MLSTYLAIFGYYKQAQKVLHDETIGHHYCALMRAVESRGALIFESKLSEVKEKFKAIEHLVY